METSVALKGLAIGSRLPAYVYSNWKASLALSELSILIPHTKMIAPSEGGERNVMSHYSAKTKAT